MKKLVGFITASLPDNNFTVDLALAMKENGVDILELGIPFSDPVADGPIIEKASLMALQNGFKLNDLFYITEKIAPSMDTFWMGYMNSFFKYGVESFLQKGKEFGIKGSIIPDLPFEESNKYNDLFTNYHQSIISFVAPTDSSERIERLVKNSKEFIYLVAYAGITGSGKSEDLSLVIESVKKYTTTPIYIGFGVDEKTAKDKIRGVDGVIVGSACVKYLVDEALSNNEKMKKNISSAREIKDKINN
ncbi:MAG: tryptophan synthase subunit alpha, partial [Arcobacter sp.]|nr:tryptophan synthase subunit alpha [Arcobacter sp.]